LIIVNDSKKSKHGACFGLMLSLPGALFERHSQEVLESRFPDVPFEAEHPGKFLKKFGRMRV